MSITFTEIHSFTHFFFYTNFIFVCCVSAFCNVLVLRSKWLSTTFDNGRRHKKNIWRHVCWWLYGLHLQPSVVLVSGDCSVSTCHMCPPPASGPVVQWSPPSGGCVRDPEGPRGDTGTGPASRDPGWPAASGAAGRQGHGGHFTRPD